jgi:hypothetical protein
LQTALAASLLLATQPMEAFPDTQQVEGVLVPAGGLAPVVE